MDNPPLSGPLWEMMLSTNGCYPGCSCVNDEFQQTPELVETWVAATGIHQAQVALRQLDELLARPHLDANAIQDQINTYFVDDHPVEPAVRDWLAKWRPLMAHSICKHIPTT